MAAILAGAAAPAFIKHAMPVKMVGSIATLDPWDALGQKYAHNLAQSMRYIKHVGVGMVMQNFKKEGSIITYDYGDAPTNPIGMIVAFSGEKIPAGWEYCDSPV